MKLCILFALAISFGASSSVLALSDPPEISTTEIARGIVDRALPSIREGGASWIDENDCLSCHRVSFQVWSLNRAQELGFQSDREQLESWNDWATDWKHMVKPELRKDTSLETALTSESDTMAQLLLGRPQIDNGCAEPDWVATYCDHLLKAQQADGFWNPVGQLPQQKRPLRETQEVTTMWVQIALRDAGVPQNELESASGRAQKWIGTDTKGQSTEWWATRLMLARTGDSQQAADQLRSALLDFQNKDGGWGWLTKDESDALGTGIALYSLARDGVLFEDDSIRRAVEFLRKTQNDDGTWNVKGTKVGDKDSVVDTASYWGAAWAVIGLLEFQRSDTRHVAALQKPDERRKRVVRSLPTLESTASAGQLQPYIQTAFRTPQVDSPAYEDVFERRIRPLLEQHCVECHAPGDSQSINFLAALTEADVAAHRDVFASVASELQTRRMPPKDFEQPADEDRALIVDWLTTKLDLKPSDTDRIAPYVVEVYEDRNGHLWLGTMGKGAARFDGKSLTWFSTKDGLPANTTHSFAEDKEGNLWAGTHGGVARFDGKTFSKVGTEQGLPKAGRPGLASSAGVQADSEKNIWVSTNTGLFRQDGSKFSEFKVPVAKEKIDSFAISAGELASPVEDSKGNLWFGTDGYGAIRFDGNVFTRFSTKDGLCSNNVNSIVEDNDGNIWFACMQSFQPKMTGDGGVCRYDGKTITKFPNIRGLNNNDIYTIYKTRSGDIWIGATGVGAYRYDGTKFTLFDKTDRKFFTRNFGVQDMLESRNGTLWFGFSGGLFRFDGQSFYNITQDGPWEGLADAMTAAAIGGEVDARLMHPTMSAALSAFAKGDTKQAGNVLHELKRQLPDEPSVQERNLNNVGYQLIWAKELDRAIELFKLNTMLYPESFNTFDSLGEAYLRKGNEPLAIQSYKQALEVNPQHKSAAVEIQKILARQEYEDLLVAPKGWFEEVLEVPPSFAQSMSFKGLEHLRIPREFRDKKSTLFCTYLFAIDLKEPANLTEKSIAEQVLVYYRGLASGRRDKQGKLVATDAFTLEPVRNALSSDRSLKVGMKGLELAEDEFAWTLNWQEPFVDRSHQKLNLRVQIMRGKNKHGIVFICASPRPFESNEWTELLRIRSTFESAPKPSESH